LKEHIVKTPQQVMELIKLGEKNRHVSATDYNEQSSRSHSIFQIVIESRSPHALTQVRLSQLVRFYLFINKNKKCIHHYFIESD
jgi:hypothetical protein